MCKLLRGLFFKAKLALLKTKKVCIEKSKEEFYMIGKITDIETMGLVDGPGMRLVVFLAGCKLRCIYCHNPETWVAGDNVREMTAEDILKLYQKYSSYYGQKGGVTFSGGEPFVQGEFLLETVKLLKEKGVHVAIDTAGVADNYEEVLRLVDLVILDIKAVDVGEYQKITGYSINSFNKFLSDCKRLNKKLWLRQVIVPNINDDKNHIFALKEFAKTIPNVERIELLPYHSMAKEKYEKLNLNYPLADTPDMEKERCKELENLLKD